MTAFEFLTPWADGKLQSRLSTPDPTRGLEDPEQWRAFAAPFQKSDLELIQDVDYNESRYMLDDQPGISWVTDQDQPVSSSIHPSLVLRGMKSDETNKGGNYYNADQELKSTSGIYTTQLPIDGERISPQENFSGLQNFAIAPTEPLGPIPIPESSMPLKNDRDLLNDDDTRFQDLNFWSLGNGVGLGLTYEGNLETLLFPATYPPESQLLYPNLGPADLSYTPIQMADTQSGILPEQLPYTPNGDYGTRCYETTPEDCHSPYVAPYEASWGSTPEFLSSPATVLPASASPSHSIKTISTADGSMSIEETSWIEGSPSNNTNSRTMTHWEASNGMKTRKSTACKQNLEPCQPHTPFPQVCSNSTVSMTKQQDGFLTTIQDEVLSEAAMSIQIQKTSFQPNHIVSRLDDMLVTFQSNPTQEGQKRKRQKFNSESRKKVHSVRESGACISCRFRRTSCSTDGVCKHCLKAAGGLALGGRICIRTKLKDTYISVRDIYGSLDSRRGDLDPLLKSLSGESIEVILSVGSYDNGAHNVAVLPLRVKKCNTSPICRWKSLAKVNGIYVTRESVYGQRYVVEPSALPTIDEVESFGRKILSISEGTHSGIITRLLDDFLLLYCKQGNATTLQRFADSTLRVLGLNGLVSYGFLDFRDGSYSLLNRSPEKDGNSGSYVSPTMHDQVRLIAAEGLEFVEESVFAQIDQYSKLIGGNKHSRIVAGICLLRLLLLYRDRVIRDEIRLGLPRQKILHRARLEQSAFMYRRLTVAYGILCREGNTPLTSDWESCSNTSTRHDDELRALFLCLKSAYHEFLTENLVENNDDIFKGLVAWPRL